MIPAEPNKPTDNSTEAITPEQNAKPKDYGTPGGEGAIAHVPPAHADPKEAAEGGADRTPGWKKATVGPTMLTVAKYTQSATGTAGFVLVGCVFYRSSFEPSSTPTHQTRFMYYLGKPIPDGGFLPNVIPRGIAIDLRLIMIPNGFSVD
jgi:hypothetical protein